MEYKIELQNVRLIESLDEKFKSGNLYMVKGKNERGKTTFAMALKSILTGEVPSDMITTGEKEGKIVGTINGANGKYKVIINLREKSNTFKIIDEDLNVSTKKSTLAEIFNYKNITVEEFLGWGLTKPGREKQAQMLINILPKEVQQKISELDSLLSTKDENSLYVQRRDTSVLLKNLSLPEPTEQDIIKDSKLDGWQVRFEKEKKEVDALLEEKSQIESLQAAWDSKKEAYGDDYLSNKRKAVAEAERALAQAKLELDRAEHNVKDLGLRPELPQIDYEKKKSDLEQGYRIIEEAKASRERIKEFKKVKQRKEELENKQKNLTEQINQKRKERQKLVSENLNVEGVVIEDGELKLDTGDALHDFTEKNISFSRASKKMLEIMLLLNPEYRIFTLGKAAEMDMQTIQDMADFAEANDAIIVLDFVEPNTENLTIVAHEKIK